jgi:hypothetical protein
VPYVYPPFYDVQESVGGGHSPNRELDVMLVQYLLFSIYFDDEWPLPFGPEIPGDVAGPGAIQPIDGMAKPELSAWIRHFQKFANSNGFGSLDVDGIVSHRGAAWGRIKPRASNFWTIHAINNVLFRSNKEKFHGLSTDSGVPKALRTEIDIPFQVDIDPVPLAGP